VPTSTPTPTTEAPTYTPTPTHTPTPTNTPGAVVPEPDLYCPVGSMQVGGTYYGELYMPAVMSIGESFVLSETSSVTIVVGSMNGHPNDGCPASGVGTCNQGQDNEAFYVLVDGAIVGFAPDHGEDRWEVFMYGAGAFGAGDHSITFAHAAIAGNNPWGSVSYKAILCASPLVSEEARMAQETPTPEVTPEVTEARDDGESAPEGDHIPTPEAIDTAIYEESPSPTPESTSLEDSEEEPETGEAMHLGPTPTAP
jgi:hypothetical protein